ncbi:protein WVD2-like 7 isoform X2 [Tripterygium wilfordii]|uniref:protein WVD2-like 7 isoform X2 n=1 Tax=Tripterygium wilfordii TaxID=458696 RepID=UPI0018F82F4C|nr:protein WVD2-like 7 isoform X2 [Tripterygium wilfordii]
MGESACLVRSFSHPSEASREDREGDPIRRALTESISFGRFMSESLAWEKWSTFSQNRYLEEVEKFSKPGSVAQKKAYFEAHYKKKAAMREAALLQEENATSDSIPESGIAETCSHSSIVEELAATNNHLDVEEQEENDVFNNEMRHSVGLNAWNSAIESDDIRTAAVERVETVVEQNVDTRIPALIENLNKIVENHGQNVYADSALQEQIPKKEDSDRERPASSSKKRPSMFKSLTIDRAYKHPSSPAKGASSVQFRAENKVGSDSKISAEDSANKKVIENGVGSLGKKSIRDFISIKKSTPNALHMSINFSSRASVSSNSSGKMSKGNLTLHNPARTSVNGMLKHPSVIGKSEDKRIKIPLNKSVSGGIMSTGKSYSLISEHPKSSNASGSKTRAPIVLSPFSFRSEERAARRKEKLEENSKVKEVEKWKLQTKSKMPVTQPQSPKLGRKPMPTRVQDITRSRPPRRPAVDAELSKRSIGKSKQSTAHSVSSLPKRSALENASPNIQQ